MNKEELYELWNTKITELKEDISAEAEVLGKELHEIKGNLAEISDRFWRDLEFGTGGLRGLMGVGTNRMNVLTVGKATQGLANYLNKQGKSASVAIAYDTRNNSEKFARRAAGVLVANGITAYLFDGVRPTPMLSYAVRHLGCDAGIVITASHNPKEYNGYKVYGADGGQITDHMAADILKEIDAADSFTDVKGMSFDSLLKEAHFKLIGEEVDAAYYTKVKKLVMREDLIKNEADTLSILYTPLHGSGNIPVRRVLAELGFDHVDIVKEQELPDGNFSTTPYPNPEEPAVYKLAIEQAKKTHPDLIFATDPDADRIGVLVQDKAGDYQVLTGNQVGVLLTDYVICTRKELGTMPENPAVIKTIVTSDMGKVIGQKNDVQIFETLTGFKYIGELVGEWEETHAHNFLLGFEESFGYLAGDFVRDKDAVIAATLITEMALYYKSQAVSLFDAMEQLYKEYGYYKEELISITMQGQEGQAEIKSILKELRENYTTIFDDMDLVKVEDYGEQTSTIISNNEVTTLTLPTSNVLKFIFSDDSWMVFRPSGTEPKIKVYLSAVGNSKDNSDLRLNDLQDKANEVFRK